MKSYNTLAELEADQANGFVVVIEGCPPEGKTYFNVTGPYETKQQAHNKAVSIRRKAKRSSADVWDDYYGYSFKVHVKPLWKPTTA